MDSRQICLTSSLLIVSNSSLKVTLLGEMFKDAKHIFSKPYLKTLISLILRQNVSMSMATENNFGVVMVFL